MKASSFKYLGVGLLGASVGGAIAFAYLYSLVVFAILQSEKKEVEEARLTALYKIMYQLRTSEEYEEFQNEMVQKKLEHLYGVKEKDEICNSSIFLSLSSECAEWIENEVPDAINMLESSGDL